MVAKEDNKPLISVIVPIYNVEKYVRKCLDSLKGQTLKEIEVICIDDGSTDDSGRIADEYVSQEWPIFRVVHTENRGLSAARNRGIDEARADWIMFVDSDDWVALGFCEIPYKAADKYETDLVIFDAWRTSESGKVKGKKRDGYKKNKILSGVVDAKDVILNGTAWNKLYSKILFENIRYPEGYTFEDAVTTHKLIHKASRIYSCEEKLYYYRKRKGSILNSKSNWLDAYYARKWQYQDLIMLGYPEKTAKLSLQLEALNYCGHAASTSDPLYCEAEAIVNAIKEIPDEFNGKSIAKLLMWRTNKHLFRTIYRIIGRRL